MLLLSFHINLNVAAHCSADVRHAACCCCCEHREGTQRKNPNSMCDVLIWFVALLSWTRDWTSGLVRLFELWHKNLTYFSSERGAKKRNRILGKSACWHDSGILQLSCSVCPQRFSLKRKKKKTQSDSRSKCSAFISNHYCVSQEAPFFKQQPN